MPNYEDRESYSDALVYRAAELFIRDGMPTGPAADRLVEEFRPAKRITRESIYPLIAEAIRREFVRMTPPVNQTLARDLARKYPRTVVAEWTRVVEPGGKEDGDKVSAVAADLAIELLGELKVGHDPARPIGLGLGPGRATRDFCVHLGRAIQRRPSVPDLMLVAIAAGGPVFAPEYTPTAFFNLLPRELFTGGKYPPTVHRKIGLFAENLVPARDFEEVKTRVGVREAFAAKSAIDLVVTSMGDMHDEHDLLGQFLAESGEDRSKLLDEGWVGNVQFRPYTIRGPIREKKGPRVVTLFELDELVALAQQQSKRVLLIARRCGLCDRTRARALRPLLENPELKVFSRLVLDAATAVDLLKD